MRGCCHKRIGAGDAPCCARMGSECAPASSLVAQPQAPRVSRRLLPAWPHAVSVSRTVLLALCLAALTGCVSVESGSDRGVDVSGGSARRETMYREQVEEMRYMRNQELMSRIAYLVRSGEDAAPALREGTKSDDWLVRSSSVYVLGQMGDRRNIPTLHACLGDTSDVVRYQAAASLVTLGDPRGFPTLVDGLGDPDLQQRFKCFQILRSATGQDFGYRHDGTPDERRLALARWHDWLDSVRASAL